MTKTTLLDYQDGTTLLEGYAAIPAGEKKPVVMVVHDWSGRNEFACETADELAKLGYIGFALDMYGKGRTGQTKEEKIALMSPLMQNRALLQQRMNAALTAVKQLPQADTARIAAIGFCFGGLCALDLARSGADINGVVSFHGLLSAPDTPSKKILAKMLVLHGFDDPMVPPDQVTAFGNEMTALKADWQLHMYSNTMHAFMNQQANDPGFGTVYQPVTAARAWRLMEDFLREIFA